MLSFASPKPFNAKITISRSEGRNIVDPMEIESATSSAGGLMSSHIKIDMQCNRIVAAIAMDEAVQSIEAGQTQNAQQNLVKAIQTIEHSSSAQQPYAKNLVADLQECARDLSSSSTVSAGTKKLSSMSTTHWHQRSSKVTAESSNANQRKMLHLMEKSRRRQILKCDKCGMIGHYARDCLQEAGASSTPEAEVQRAKQLLKCTKCGQQGHSVDDCLQQSGTCHVCGKTGHLAKDCWDKDKCHFCGVAGHQTKDCQKKKDTCNKCGKPGHFAKDCTPSACFKCGQSGHFSRECPQSHSGTSSPLSSSSLSATGGGSNNNTAPVAAPSATPAAAPSATPAAAPPTSGKCHNCGQAGHFVRECPNKGAGGSGSSSGNKCHNCGKPGHIARECTEKKRRR